MRNLLTDCSANPDLSFVDGNMTFLRRKRLASADVSDSVLIVVVSNTRLCHMDVRYTLEASTALQKLAR